MAEQLAQQVGHSMPVTSSTPRAQRTDSFDKPDDSDEPRKEVANKPMNEKKGGANPGKRNLVFAKTC